MLEQSIQGEQSFPALNSVLFDLPKLAKLEAKSPSPHAPRFLLLYGSLRARSFSRLLALEAARLLQAMGGEVRFFDPTDLPLPSSSSPKSISKISSVGIPPWHGRSRRLDI